MAIKTLTAQTHTASKSNNVCYVIPFVSSTACNLKKLKCNTTTAIPANILNNSIGELRLESLSVKSIFHIFPHVKQIYLPNSFSLVIT